MVGLIFILLVVGTLFTMLGWVRIIIGSIRGLRRRKQHTGKWLLLLTLCFVPSLSDAAQEAICDTAVVVGQLRYLGGPDG